MKSVLIMGVRVDAIAKKEALRLAAEMLEKDGANIITTPNPEMILKAQSDHEFKNILNGADLAIPDGVGIIWAAKKLGARIDERVTGADFLLNLAEIAWEKGKKIALVGGKTGVPKAAAKAFKNSYTELEARGFVCGEIDGVGVQIPEKLLNEIKNFAPEIIAVALGQGKQEKFIVRLLPLVPSVKIAIGIGGALDYISGRKRRAPKWMRERGLEWLWRLLNEPWRLPRIINAAIVFPIKFLL